MRSFAQVVLEVRVGLEFRTEGWRNGGMDDGWKFGGHVSPHIFQDAIAQKSEGKEKRFPNFLLVATGILVLGGSSQD